MVGDYGRLICSAHRRALRTGLVAGGLIGAAIGALVMLALTAWAHGVVGWEW